MLHPDIVNGARGQGLLDGAIKALASVIIARHFFTIGIKKGAFGIAVATRLNAVLIADASGEDEPVLVAVSVQHTRDPLGDSQATGACALVCVIIGGDYCGIGCGCVGCSAGIARWWRGTGVRGAAIAGIALTETITV